MHPIEEVGWCHQGAAVAALDLVSRAQAETAVAVDAVRFPKGFRSTGQLMNGIGADRETTGRLLLAIGARHSENSDEWTLRPPPTN